MNKTEFPQIAQETVSGENVTVYALTENPGKLNASSVAIFTALLAAVVIAPLAGNQMLTGTIVNASLFLSVVFLGLPAALLMGALPSVISAVTGLLPALIFPMVPFIILSNWLLAATFARHFHRRMWAVVLASVLKFTVLSVTATFLVPAWLGAPLALPLLWMMSWPQLITALSGGVVALGVIGFYTRRQDNL